MSIRAAADRVRLFNIRELRAHPGRTVMSVSVIAVSAALLVAVFGITGSITGSADRLVNGIAGDANLEVSGITDAGFDQSIVAEVAGVTGVRAAVPMLRTQIGADEQRALLIGSDLTISKLNSPLQNAITNQSGGAAALLTTPNGVFTGSGMGYSPGQQFSLGKSNVTVAGVVSGKEPDRINAGHFVATSLPLAQTISGRPGKVDSIMIVTAPGARLGTVRAAVDAVVNGRAVVADPAIRTAQSTGAISILRFAALLSASAALVVAAFLVYNAMSMAVAQRRPAISMLRAIGGRRGAIVGELLAEATILGLLGGIGGAIVGVFLGRGAIGNLPRAIVQSMDARTEYVLPGYAIPVAIIACVAASVGATAIAARQVYKVQPIEALAPVGASTVDRPNLLLQLIIGGIGLVVAVAAGWAASVDLGPASVVVIAGAINAALALCFAFSGPIVAAARRVASIFGAPGALAATTIDRAPRRIWATVMTVMIAVVTTVSTLGTNADVVDSSTASFEELGKADMYVTPTPADVFPTVLLPSDLRSQLEKLPGVDRVPAGQIAYASVGNARVMMFGIAQGSYSNALTPMSAQVRERMFRGEGVVLSRDVARSLNVTAGDWIELPAPAGRQRLLVLQVIPYFSAIGGVIAMNKPSLEQWFQRTGDTVLQVIAQPGVDKSALQAEVRKVVPAQLQVYSGKESIEGISGGMKQATALLGNISWIVIGVAAIALLNTLMLSVLERRRELGVLRAIGASRRFTLRTVLAEAAAIGIVGAGMGLLVSTVTRYLNTRALSNVLTIDVGYHLTPMVLVFGVAALALTMLGAIAPAVRAARLNIVKAIEVD